MRYCKKSGEFINIKKNHISLELYVCRKRYRIYKFRLQTLFLQNENCLTGYVSFIACFKKIWSITFKITIFVLQEIHFDNQVFPFSRVRRSHTKNIQLCVIHSLIGIVEKNKYSKTRMKRTRIQLSRNLSISRKNI